MFWTDRHGGASSGRYASLNLGDHVGDVASAVAENRRRLCLAIAERTVAPGAMKIVWLRQVHGAHVHNVTGPSSDVSVERPPMADAAVTALSGIGLAVLTADCVPIALACDDAVGVAHAGWKGLMGGVVGEAVAELRRVGSGTVKALIGPCIHPARYEFGSSELDRLAAHLGPRVIALTDRGTPALDLPVAARIVLERSGVAEVDIESVGECTAASARYFSHRRDGATGRQAMIAVLVP